MIMGTEALASLAALAVFLDGLRADQDLEIFNLCKLRPENVNYTWCAADLSTAIEWDLQQSPTLSRMVGPNHWALVAPSRFGDLREATL